MHHRPSFSRQCPLFLLLMAAALSPALINGYPLYFPDSAQYDGHLLRGFERSATPALLSAPLYPIFGVWSLAIINATAFAFLVTKYAAIFLSSVNPLAIFLLACITLAPFYVSFLMPDIWIAFLFIAILLLQQHFSWSVFAIAVLACSGHGSHAPILGATGLAAFLFGLMSLKALRQVAVIIAVSISISFVLDNLVFRYTRMSTAVVASKVMNDVPEAFSRYCQMEPAATICGIKEKIAAIPPHSIRDDQYLWAPGVWRGGRLSLSEFNALGTKLWWIAVTEYPLAYLRSTAADFWRLIYPSQCLGYGGFVAEEARWIRHLNQFDLHTLARRGYFMGNSFCSGIFWIVVVFSTLTGLAVARLLFASDYYVRSHAFILGVGIFVNAAFFALTAGSFARYHLRMLALAGLILMLHLALKRRSKVVTGALRSPVCGERPARAEQVGRLTGTAV